jgi:hypothetical protein
MKMYTREITPAPEKLVQNGKPVFGTFDSLPKKLDIKGVTTPYAGVPYPPILSRLTIRARAVYVFSLGDYVGVVQFFGQQNFEYGRVRAVEHQAGNQIRLPKIFGRATQDDSDKIGRGPLFH